jgi:hypothetical protein
MHRVALSFGSGQGFAYLCHCCAPGAVLQCVAVVPAIGALDRRESVGTLAVRPGLIWDLWLVDDCWSATQAFASMVRCGDRGVALAGRGAAEGMANACK